MKKRNETDSLNELIIIQKMKHANDFEQLKDQFHLAYESVKPINLIKNLFHEVTASPEIKNDLLSNVIGFSTGFISKKILLGSSHNPIKKVFSTVIEFAVSNLVSKHTGRIKLIGGNLLKYFLKKQKPNLNQIE